MISNLPPSLMTGDSVMSSRYRGKYDLKLTTISYDRRRRFCYEFQVQRQV